MENHIKRQQKLKHDLKNISKEINQQKVTEKNLSEYRKKLTNLSNRFGKTAAKFGKVHADAKKMMGPDTTDWENWTGTEFLK